MIFCCNAAHINLDSCWSVQSKCGLTFLPFESTAYMEFPHVSEG